jgi:hypothetical protein
MIDSIIPQGKIKMINTLNLTLSGSGKYQSTPGNSNVF